MSAFLGKIHYWLYNKIQLQEKLINDINNFVKEKGYSADTILDASYSRYGGPIFGELEEVIEHSNIHGWLQEQIISVENRLAYVVTELKKENVISDEDIASIFYQDGLERGKEYGTIQGSPEALFQLIFDYMLEGMPCDRVNNIISNTENEIIWETTRDLHKEYWDNVDGEIELFYKGRQAWINGFLSAIGTSYQYICKEDGMNEIRKVG